MLELPQLACALRVDEQQEGEEENLCGVRLALVALEEGVCGRLWLLDCTCIFSDMRDKACQRAVFGGSGNDK